MNAAQRRERILTRLNSAGAPLSASTLAAELGVSRQIVVGDVALLRAGGAQIDATPRGYQLHPAEKGYTGILACVHRTQEEMRWELYTVVDQGGTVVDVAVENSLYGEIRATLNLCNRYDVDNFIRQAADAPESLLSRMTGGVHLHTLRCPDKDTFARIRDALEQQGLLTARSDPAPLIPSIKRLAGLVYPQNRKNVGKSTKMQKRWVFWISALKRLSAPSKKPLWSCAAKSRWRRSVSRNCATAPVSINPHFTPIIRISMRWPTPWRTRWCMRWWKVCPA